MLNIRFPSLANVPAISMTGSSFLKLLCFPENVFIHENTVSGGSFLDPFYCPAVGKTVLWDFIGHIACYASSLPTTSLLIADFACILPNFPAFLLGIGRMKIFHCFSAQNQLSFWTFEEILAPYAHIRSTNFHSDYTSIHFGAFEAYSAHMPKISSPASQTLL